MPRSSPPKEIIPPPKRYPRWMESADTDLKYLGWGLRKFDVDPVPMHSNGGWAYWVVTEGHVLVEFENAIKRFDANTGLLAGPDLPFGFPKEGQAESKILVWIWKSPPPFFPETGKNTYAPLSFSFDEIELIDHLHRQCRNECLNADELSPETSKSLHRILDVTFTRAFKQNHESGQTDAQLRIARQWMLNHLDAARPVEELARFLNVSSITVHRLFKGQLQESPGIHFRRLKMERAKELLKHKRHSVKYIAYELGYKHSRDFSRSYRKFWGTPPTAE